VRMSTAKYRPAELHPLPVDTCGRSGESRDVPIHPGVSKGDLSVSRRMSDLDPARKVSRRKEALLNLEKELLRVAWNSLGPCTALQRTRFPACFIRARTAL